MKYKLKNTSEFKHDLKRVKKRHCDLDLLKTVINTLLEGEQLDPKYKDHALTGNFDGCRECHLEPDWLLIYKYLEEELVLVLTRTGTHSDLFRIKTENKKTLSVSFSLWDKVFLRVGKGTRTLGLQSHNLTR